MVKDVQDLCKEVVAARFASATVESENKSMYIDPMLFHIPLAIGDRSETIQDTSCALQGTRFPVEGDKVRLFMQWGKGLPAQHLDMDLSCHITLPSTTEVCSFFNLQAIGAKHSGDIRSIPNKKGTAEYIELDLNELNRVGAEYVAFTCNAYSNGTISPNLVVDELCLSNEDIGKNRSSLRSFLRTTSGTYFPKFAERACFRSSESERTGNRLAGNTFWWTDDSFFGYTDH